MKETDIEHFYVEKGTGDALILLHGNGEDSSYFAKQIEAFSADCRVIAPDTRGHGKTPRGKEPFTIRQFAEDLAAFMDRLGICSAHILGFSDGANIAMCFALRYPRRVKKLILNGGNLSPAGIKRYVQIPIEIGYQVAKLFEGRNRKALEHAEMLGLMVNDPDIRPEKLSKIEAETLVIAGTGDMVKEKHTRLIAASIPGAELVLIEGNHFIANKKPDSFNAAVKKFLKKKKDNKLILVIGGSGSGKSEYAEKRILEFAGKKKIYLATMDGADPKGEERIRRHQAMRAGKGFVTVEKQKDLEESAIEEGADVLLEDLGNLVANELFSKEMREKDEKDLLCHLKEELLHIKDKAGNFVVVSNDIFSDGTVYEGEMLAYQKLLADCNRALAGEADEVIEVVCGLPNYVKQIM